MWVEPCAAAKPLRAGVDDVVLDELEPAVVARDARKFCGASGLVIVEADDVRALGDQARRTDANR